MIIWTAVGMRFRFSGGCVTIILPTIGFEFHWRKRTFNFNPCPFYFCTLTPVKNPSFLTRSTIGLFIVRTCLTKRMTFICTYIIIIFKLTFRNIDKKTFEKKFKKWKKYSVIPQAYSQIPSWASFHLSTNPVLNSIIIY